LNGFVSRTWVIRVFQTAVAIGLLATLWHFFEGEKVSDLLIAANPIWLLASFFILTLQVFFSAWRWRLISKGLGLHFSASTAIREYYLAQFLNQGIPGGILGDASRAARFRTHAGLMVSASSVILERFAGQLGSLAILSIAFFVTAVIPGGLDWPMWIPSVVLLSLFAMVLLILLLVAFIRTSSTRVARTLRELLLSAGKTIGSASSVWVLIFLSAATAICNVAGFTFAAWAIGVPFAFSAALVLVPMVLFAMLLPISIAGWGLREGAAVILLPIAGFSATEGLAASVTFGLVSLVAVIPGLLFVKKKVEQSSLDLVPLDKVS
jgi:uncharacterized membrane protein YbhN (UPF0104 family)